MKAAQINQYGGPEVLVTVPDAPKPSINPDQVLVEVYSAGVNPFDGKVRQGLARQMAEVTFPAVLGGDLAGVVAEVGEKVKHLKVGDPVYGQAGALSSHGSFAEYAPAAAAALSPAPENLDIAEAAALPLAGVSAYQALVETIHLKHGQKILIHGGAGGIGGFAIQLAKHLGAYVATTADATSIEYVQGLGADEVIDYNAQKFQELLTDYDAVFDTIGGEVFTDSFKVLKHGGRIVTMAAQADEALDKQYGVHSFGQYTQVTTERLAKLAKLVEDGAIKVQIDKTFPLDQAGAALGYLETGSHHGKVVIHVRD